MLLEFDLSSSMVLENSPRNMEERVRGFDFLGGSTGSRTTRCVSKSFPKIMLESNNSGLDPRTLGSREIADKTGMQSGKEKRGE